MSIRGTFSYGDLVQLPEIPVRVDGSDRILRLGRYPDILTMRPVGTPLQGQPYEYMDAYGTVYSNAEYQLYIRCQFAISLNCAGKDPDDPNFSKYLGYTSRDELSTQWVYDNTERYYAQGQYPVTICAIDPKYDFGFLPFTPLNDIEYYDGLYPFETVLFAPSTPRYLISDLNGQIYLRFDYNSNTQTTFPCLFYNTPSMSPNTPYVIPRIRQPWDMWYLTMSNYISVYRFYVDIVPINGG